MADKTVKSSPHGDYAFLNHSTATMPNNLPPSVDDRPLGRQKRRRTSPEDQAILEDAYKCDPKPDKTARLELVKQVSLGEKEVQIWFQNRRQSSRRKSRPLLPHEVAQYQLSKAGFPGSSPESTYEPRSPEEPVEEVQHHRRDSSPPAPGTTEPEACSVSAPSQSESFSLTATDPAMASCSQPQTVGYLANRRRAASLLHHNAEEHYERAEMAKADSGRRVKKSTSFVRLSLNAEGKAEVVTKDAESPSPPRPPQTLLPEFAAPVPSAIPAVKQLERSFSGRSRDSRAWEFWCDKESRSEFESTAEKDATGSAVGAIGLLRSTSGRNILGNLSTKRNAALSAHHPSKRSKLEHKRAPLQRSNTSLGRLQGGQTHGTRKAPKLKQSESALAMPGKGADSDKENMSPSSVGEPFDYPSGRRRQQAGAGNEDGGRIRLSHVRQDRSGNGDADPENDEELATFMRGGQKKANVSGDDDFDCIQGLLSLSQGNWR